MKRILVFSSFFSRRFSISIRTMTAQSENLSKADDLQGDRKAFIVGYTGESGKALIKELIGTKVFQKVNLLGRREVQLPSDAGDLFEQKLVNFEDLETNADCFQNVDVGFCCLGTTRGKSGGKEGFVKVDRDYVLNTAEIAKKNGCKHFSIVTSQGSNPNSSFLYPKTKGEVEERLKEMKFEKLSIFRPGLLMCDREESRPFERFLRCCFKPLAYLFPTAGTTPTSVLARAMINDVKNPDSSSVNVFENPAIHSLAKPMP